MHVLFIHENKELHSKDCEQLIPCILYPNNSIYFLLLLKNFIIIKIKHVNYL